MATSLLQYDQLQSEFAVSEPNGESADDSATAEDAAEKAAEDFIDSSLLTYRNSFSLSDSELIRIGESLLAKGIIAALHMRESVSSGSDSAYSLQLCALSEDEQRILSRRAVRSTVS